MSSCIKALERICNLRPNTSATPDSLRVPLVPPIDCLKFLELVSQKGRSLQVSFSKIVIRHAYDDL